jgi:peptide methionine sulfoxide reductase msrA/msrB
MILKTQSLSPSLLKIIQDKGTEQPFSGELNEFNQAGTYVCRQCGLALFRSHAKFHSGCGWPSFDAEIKGAVKRVLDSDGNRTEILCTRCNGHLGHVFSGERFTANNIRHCVNSVSLDFVPDINVMEVEEALFAAGCFWGVESLFKKLPGVLKTEVGYMGDQQYAPSYQEVCKGETGHVETLRILYDPTKINYEEIVKYFFEIHDPGQTEGQGPDRGEQYRSVIFYYDDLQKKTAESLILALEKKGYSIATCLWPVSIFWRAEDYHQDYYQKNKQTPYCHFYTKRF